MVTGEQEMHLVNISPGGKFSVAIPLKYNNEVWVSFPFFNGTVYFEPGKRQIQDFDISGPTKITSVFKGDCATTNNDFNKVRAIIYQYNWDAIYADIYQLTPQQYKTYFLRIKAHKLAAVDSVAKTERLSKKAIELAASDIKYSIANILTQFNYNREAAYRMKNKIGFDSRIPILSEVKLDARYYDFLNSFKYNDPSAMVPYDYSVFINRLKFLSLIYDKATTIDYTKQINQLKQQDTTNEDIKATLVHFRNSMKRKATAVGALEHARPVVLKSLLKTNITLELELMDLQDLCRGVSEQNIPLSNAKLDSLKRQFKYQSFFLSLVEINNKVKNEIETSELQAGNMGNSTPAIVADSVFDNIISKYKGKTIFIDFWATWCGPCIQGIEEIAPIKADLMDKNVVFMYITNDTSPEKAYRTLIPKIKGEHYRLTADEYNVLSARFEISGIPHYAIVNEKGVVVNKNFGWRNTEDIKKTLLSLPAN